MRIFWIYTTIISTLSVLNSYGQKIVGQISDESNNEPLIGVNIILNGSADQEATYGVAH